MHRKKCESMNSDQCWAGRHGENCSVVIFSHIKNVELSMKLLLIDLYPLRPLSVTLTLFEGHSGVTWF